MNGIEWTFELRFAVALALGFLLGLERESAGAERKTRVFAGVRTYSIISLYGFGCGWLYHINATLALPVGMLSLAALALVGYVGKLREGGFGWTSEVSALLTFIIGALCILADVWVPMALGIITTLLLSEKADIEQYVERLERSEFLAVLKFLLVTVIILPVLPNREYTMFNLNPTRIWQIVIMVSTIGFVGYFLIKKYGSAVGLWLSGLLGGIVSSTAVAIAAGRIAQRHPERSHNALQASTLASSIMYIRILVLVWIFNPSFIAYLWWKMVILAATGIALSVRRNEPTAATDDSTVPSFQNPFEIRPAVIFAILFVALSVLTMLVEQAFGSTGLLALSGIVGVTDIDPFILSLVQRTVTIQSVTVAAIIMAMLSNTVVKGIYFGALSKQMRKETYQRYGIWALVHVPLLLY